MTVEKRLIKDQYISLCELAEELRDITSDLMDFNLVNPDFFKSVSKYVEFCENHFNVEEKNISTIVNNLGEWLSCHKKLLQPYKFFKKIEDFSSSTDEKTDFTLLCKKFNEIIEKGKENDNVLDPELVEVNEFLFSYCEFKKSIKDSDYADFNQKRMDDFFKTYCRYSKVVLLDHQVEMKAIKIYMRLLNKYVH